MSIDVSTVDTTPKCRWGSRLTMQWPSSWSQSSFRNCLPPSHLPRIASVHIIQSFGFSVVADDPWYTSKYPSSNSALRIDIVPVRLNPWASQHPPFSATTSDLEDWPRTRTFIGTVRRHFRRSTWRGLSATFVSQGLAGFFSIGSDTKFSSIFAVWMIRREDSNTESANLISVRCSKFCLLLAFDHV